MSLNLDEQQTYSVQLGSSLQGSFSEADEDGFHLVSRQLPRTTTKVSRETLENGRNARVRLPQTQRPVGEGRRSLLLEADSPDTKATCTYEGEFEVLPREGDEVACVLIYDDELKAFTVERLASQPVVRSGVPNASAAVQPSAAGALALPANKHDPAREKKAVRRDSEMVMDEALEDDLAKELEGMLDDDSDGVDAGSRRSSVRQQQQQPPPLQSRRGTAEDLRENSEDQLAESLDEALFAAAAAAGGSDDDEFEEVDGADLPLAQSHRDGRSDDDLDASGDMVFEEIDPSVGDFSPQTERLGGSLLEDDSDQFEEISGSRVNSMAAKDVDEGLFEGSFTASPVGYSEQASPLKQPPGQKSMSLDEFEDLDLDLTRSLESS
ncbi:hypothetical protein GGF46_005141 [Coemansia sp. RSA 552]|nr:hypothetical protein GGF46_005141 [Coemansia sp. RSA 552]